MYKFQKIAIKQTQSINEIQIFNERALDCLRWILDCFSKAFVSVGGFGVTTFFTSALACPVAAKNSARSSTPR
jgi:hypothetical protein